MNYIKIQNNVAKNKKASRFLLSKKRKAFHWNSHTTENYYIPILIGTTQHFIITSKKASIS